MTGKELIELLEKSGWFIDRIRGSHYIMIKSGSTLSVPLHGKKDLCRAIEPADEGWRFKMIRYPAKIKYSGIDKVFLVEFPDLPGCHTFGETREEAITMAEEALSAYLESIDLRKIKIPGPSALKGRCVVYISPDSKTAFAVWMKLKRMEKGLTQKKAAELLGISFQSYQKFENPGKANPTLTTLKKIESLFDEKILLV